MKAKKIYLQPSGVVYMGMIDLMDAQNGKEIFSDYTHRTLHLHVMMFDRAWTLRFTAMEIDWNRCEAALEVIAKETDMELQEEERALASYVLRREYAMLDAMLLIGTPVEATYDEEG